MADQVIHSLVSELNTKIATFETGDTTIGQDYAESVTTNNVKYTKRADGLVMVTGEFTVSTPIVSTSGTTMFTGLPASNPNKHPLWIMVILPTDHTVRRLQMLDDGRLREIYESFPQGNYEIIPFDYFSN